MNPRPLFIPVILGTVRKGRTSENVAKFVFGEVQKRESLETELIDISDLHFPADDAGEQIKNKIFSETCERADGFVIVAPEYNHGYPGMLKHALDSNLKEYIHKAVAFVGVSAGPWGGTRVIEALLPTVRELGLAATFTDLNFPYVQRVFSDGGELLDQAFENRAKDFLDELVWMSCGLRWARQNLPSKYHDIG